jgi:hypothetical protein
LRGDRGAIGKAATIARLIARRNRLLKMRQSQIVMGGIAEASL